MALDQLLERRQLASQRSLDQALIAVHASIQQHLGPQVRPATGPLGYAADNPRKSL
jgi:hypothetical protein